MLHISFMYIGLHCMSAWDINYMYSFYSVVYFLIILIFSNNIFTNAVNEFNSVLLCYAMLLCI